MSEALRTPVNQPEQDAKIYDLARTQQVNEAMDQFDAWQPQNLSEAQAAVSTVNSLQEALHNDSVEGEAQVGSTAAERVAKASEAGLNKWVLTGDQAEAVQKTAAGERPQAVSYKEWLAKTKTEKQIIARDAKQQLALSADIVKSQKDEANKAQKETHDTHKEQANEYRKQRQEKLAEKMEAEKTRVADEAYDAKRAELEVIREERVASALAKAAQVTGNARTMLEANLRKRFDRDVEDDAVKASTQAASDRERFVLENGGPAAINFIRQQEAAAAQVEAFQRRIHGSDYDNWKRKQGDQSEPSAPKEQTVRPDAVPYKEWLNLSPSERKLRAEAVNDIPGDITETLWNTLPEDARQIWNQLDDDEKANLRNYYAPAEPTESPLEIGQDGTYELRGNKDRLSAASQEPVTDPSPKGLKARWGRLMGRAWAGLQSVKQRASDIQEYYSDEEKGQKRKIVAGVVGAGALIGAGVGIYLATRHGGTVEQVVTHKPKRHAPVTHQPRVATPHKPVANNYQEVKLKPGSGDSLWSEERLHHPHETERQILERVQRDEIMNHIHNEREAEHMSGTVKISR